MSLHLFRRNHTCAELGVCQRTGPECRKACHQATETDDPVGYEAARTAQIFDFPTFEEWRDQQHAKPAAQEDPEQQAMAVFSNVVLRASITVLGTIALLGLVGYSMAMPDSWLHDAMDWIRAAYCRSLHMLA